MKIFKFEQSYGSFTDVLTYGKLNLKLKVAHKYTIVLNLGDNLFAEFSAITASTPKTYYAGNRTYGKYIFNVPDNVKVVKTEYSGNSNAEAVENNTSLIKSDGYSGGSFGFDFFKINVVGDETCYMEIPEKIENLEFAGIGDLQEEIFVKHAMPENLRELIPNFWHQTSGWRRNETETHLHAVTRINEISTFIPFASDRASIDEIPNIYTTYLKQIK